MRNVNHEAAFFEGVTEEDAVFVSRTQIASKMPRVLPRTSFQFVPESVGVDGAWPFSAGPELMTTAVSGIQGHGCSGKPKVVCPLNL